MSMVKISKAALAAANRQDGYLAAVLAKASHDDADYIYMHRDSYQELRRQYSPGLGDMVAAGLATVGITKERVQAVASKVGIKDCGCAKRQAALNEFGKRLRIGNADQRPPLPAQR